MVSRVGDLANRSRVGVNRSTNGTPFLAATSAIAFVYSSSRALVSAPSGRFGVLWFSNAIGLNSTSLGADLPLYFWPRVWVMNCSRSALNFGSPASPAHDSLYPKKAKTTSALVPTFSNRLAGTFDGSVSFRGCGTGALADSHWSGVPKSIDRSRTVSSSAEKPRLRMVRSWAGWRATRYVSSQPSCCMRSASVLPTMQT